MRKKIIARKEREEQELHFLESDSIDNEGNIYFNVEINYNGETIYQIWGENGKQYKQIGDKVYEIEEFDVELRDEINSYFEKVHKFDFDCTSEELKALESLDWEYYDEEEPIHAQKSNTHVKQEWYTPYTYIQVWHGQNDNPYYHLDRLGFEVVDVLDFTPDE